MKIEDMSQTERLDFIMGTERHAVGRREEHVVTEKLKERVTELANRMDESLNFKAQTKAQRAAAAKSAAHAEELPILKRSHSLNWRERVARAKEHAAATLSVLQILDFGLTSKRRNYFDTMPPAIEEALDDDYPSFLAEYAKAKKAISEIKEEADKNRAAKEKEVAEKKSGRLKAKAKQAVAKRKALVKAAKETQEERTDVFVSEDDHDDDDIQHLFDAAAAAKLLKDTEMLLGVPVTDERVDSSLRLLDVFLSRANEFAGLETLTDAEGEKKMKDPLLCPLLQSHKTWLTNPASKADVMRWTSDAKSNAKYGKTAVIIFAGDLGPVQVDGNRQPLYSMDPYELLIEMEQKTRDEEHEIAKSRYLKSPEYKEERDAAIARGEFDEDASPVFPFGPPPRIRAPPTHVEHMSFGSRMMTQLVNDVTENCGAKAVGLLPVIIITSDATESMILKDFHANEYYGLNKEKLLFVNQPSMPGFRYVEDLNIFREDSTSKPGRYGSAHAMELLTYPGEAYKIVGNRGTKGHVVESAMDILSTQGVEWIYKTHIRLIQDSGFDVNFQAHVMHLEEQHKMNLVFKAVQTSLHSCRKWGNIVAHRPTTKEGAYTKYLARIFNVDELNTSAGNAVMTKMFNEGDGEGNSMMYSDTGVWMIKLSALQSAMDGFRFTPSFCLEHKLGDAQPMRHLKAVPAVYPQIDANDLTHVDAIRSMGVLIDPAADALKDVGADYVEDPMRLAMFMNTVQDANVGFQTLVKKSVMAMAAKGLEGGAALVLGSTSSTTRHEFMVCIDNNDQCKHALEIVDGLTLAGVDKIHLVNVCKVQDEPKARKMLSQFDVEAVVPVVRHVLIQQAGLSVPDMLVQHAMEIQATMIVVASVKLDRSVETKIGSVAVALTRKPLPCSLLVVKSHSQAHDNIDKHVNWMLGVEPSSLAMFEWVSELARRGKDRMHFVNCSGTELSAGVSRDGGNSSNLLSLFKDKSIARGYTPFTHNVDGKAAVELPKLMQTVKADFLVVSASKKSGEVSKGCSRILKDPKTSAVLFFKHPVNMDFVL
jgi:nucleotide-binding universal stress UspA family protein